MPITSSSVAEIAPQRDGRSYVREIHTDDRGREHVVTYLTGGDPSSQLAQNAQQLSERLVEAEAGEVIAHVLAGHSIDTFPFSDLTKRQGARRVLRHLTRLEDVRPARHYAQVVVNAGAARVASALAITQDAARGVVTWAQGVLDSLATQDAAKAHTGTALAEIGEE